jgi:hypothetical protein
MNAPFYLNTELVSVNADLFTDSLSLLPVLWGFISNIFTIAVDKKIELAIKNVVIILTKMMKIQYLPGGKIYQIIIKNIFDNDFSVLFLSVYLEKYLDFISNLIIDGLLIFLTK